MAKCGIKKYDELPAVVEWIDVDMLRWHLYNLNHPRRIWSLPVVGSFIKFLMIPSMSKERTIYLLEKALKNHITVEEKITLLEKDVKLANKMTPSRILKYGVSDDE